MFVDLREARNREEFIDDLFEVVDGIHFKKDKNPVFNFTKEDIINSQFPIVINIENLEIDFLRSTTSAAAAISNKEMFVTPKIALCILIAIQNHITYESDYVLDGDSSLRQPSKETYLDFSDDDYAKAKEFIEKYVSKEKK